MTHEAGQLPGVTAFIVDIARRIDSHALPPDVVAMAQLCVLDWLGGAVAGAREPLVGALLEEARAQGGHPLATVVVHGERTSPTFAALINGAAADALDYSDTNLAMRGHSTPAVVATALALAEARDASGRELLAAVVAGVETECRVGLLVRAHLRPGFHPTGNLAPFGAAAAAAHLLGLSPERWAHALGIVATQCAGLLASGGTMSKPLHSGKAAMNGLLAASLAAREFVGRADAIEASEGFVATHATGRDEAALYASRDRCFILDTIFKQHAACMLTHSTIENMLCLTREHGVTPEQVARLELEVPSLFLGVCNIQEPVTGLQGKFSLRATAAMVLLGDDTTDVNSYTAERVTRPELRALRDRTHVSARDDFAEEGASAAVVDLTDGRRLRVTSNAYRPIADLTHKQAIVCRKFATLAVPVLGDRAADALRDLVFALDRAESVRPLLRRATLAPA